MGTVKGLSFATLKLQRTISRRAIVMTDLSVETYMDYQLDAIVMTLKAQLLAGEFENASIITESFYEIPATLWEHVKQVIFPTWLKKRLPVRYRKLPTATYIVHRYKVCPHIAMPGEATHIEFLKGRGE